MRKYASFDSAQVLDIKGSRERDRTASLSKLADFGDYRTEDGYLYARIGAISSRVNKNYDGWPSVELAGSKDIFDHHTASEGFTIQASRDADYGFSTFLGKPIFVDHHNSNPERARGVIVDAKFHVEDHKTAALDSYYSSDGVDSEHLPPSWVELLLEVDANSFPRLAKAIIEGSQDPSKGIDGFSMGCDVERSVCNICKNSASAPEDFCNHIKLKGYDFDRINPKTGKVEKTASYENCYGIKFFEISAVFDPADETALTREVRSSVQHEGANLYDGRPGLLLDSDVACPYCVGTGTEDKMYGGPCPHCKGSGAMSEGPIAGEGVAALRDMAGPGTGTPIIDGQSSGLGPVHQGAEEEKKLPLKDLADLQEEEYLEESEKERQERKKKKSWVEGPGTEYQPDPVRNEAALDEKVRELMMRGVDQETAYEMAEKMLMGQTPQLGDGDVYAPKQWDYRTDVPDMATVAPNQNDARFSHKTADHPLPQSELTHAPEEINTLREDKVCPVCGSSMDEETCDICGYTEPPESFQNPDLDKAKETDLRIEEAHDQEDQQPDQPMAPNPGGEPSPEVTPRNPSALSHVTRDMEWDVPTPKTAGRINKAERPLAPGAGSKRPTEQVIKDQPKPVTSSVRTASDFIAAAGATNRKTEMERTADAATGAPEAAKPDVNVDTTGVGGVEDASNEAASKADAQINVLDKGGTGVEGVSADSTTSVEQGDEHSKNIEAIPTKTYDDGSSAVERQADPVSNEPFPASADGVKASRWVVEGHDDAPFPNDEIEGGNAVEGTQPSDPVGKAEDRVDVLDHVTSPGNNSGPTKTWSGTDGNGVTQQQDPVTNESIAQGESGLQDGGIYNTSPAKSSAHIFTAMKVADLEVELGLASERYARAAELEKESPERVATLLETLTRVKTAGLQKARKTAGAQRLPVMGRSSNEEKQEEPKPEGDDSFLFGA